MKYFYILSLFLSTVQTVLPMKATFFGPSSYIEKPRFARNNLTTIEMSADYNRASKGYHKKGQKVPLLAYRGVEPLLPQFTDKSVPINTATPLCYGLFDANYKGLSYNFSWVQNIHESFFFELSSSISQDKIQDITLVPTSVNGKPLTTQEIDANTKLKTYLPLLQEQIGTEQERNYVGPSYFLMGYTKSMTTFDYLDFVDITVQTGCIVPLVVLDTCQPNLSVFPRQDIVNLGIPLQLTIALGVYDWLNIGASGSVTNYIKNDRVVPLNRSSAPNKLLIPESGMCSIYHEPKIALSAYIEGEYFLPNWTWFIGVSYTKQNPTQYEPSDSQKFPTRFAINQPVQHEWEIASFTLASEFDLSNNQTCVMPRCKLMYTKPFYGRTCFASSLLSGQLGLEISYDF